MNQRTFIMPEGLTHEQAALTLNGYLAGHLAREPGNVGPWQKKVGSDAHWQLDPHNNYYLRFFENGEAVVGSKFRYHDEKLDAMYKLFEVAWLGVYA